MNENDISISTEKVVNCILENTHESLKWVWQVLMALSLVNAVKTFSQAIKLKDITTAQGLLSSFLCVETVVFVSFCLVFIRFFFGDSRHLDLSYLETREMYGLGSVIDKYTGSKRFFDIVLLMANGTVLFFMSEFIGSPTAYIFVFLMLMVINIIWLLVSFIVYRGSNAKEGLFSGMKRFDPLLRWSANNFVFLSLMSAIIIYGGAQDRSIVLTLILATILNSIFDFLVTWRFYFPDLEMIYRENSESGGQV